MKKMLAMLLAILTTLSLSACRKNHPEAHSTDSVQNSENISTTKEEEINTNPIDNDEYSLDTLEDALSTEFEDTITTLENEWEELKNTTASYDAYIENTTKIETFYNKINSTVEQMCITMGEFALKYADIIIKSNGTLDDMYDDFDEIYDAVYNDAGDKIYDKIYDDLFDDIYDSFYDGILDDAYDTIPYKEWSKVHSNEYDWWSDTHSDVYDNWSDMRSDIYDFWSDARGDLWDNDIESAKERIEDFRKDIFKMKSN